MVKRREANKSATEGEEMKRSKDERHKKDEEDTTQSLITCVHCGYCLRQPFVLFSSYADSKRLLECSGCGTRFEDPL